MSKSAPSSKFDYYLLKVIICSFVGVVAVVIAVTGLSLFDWLSFHPVRENSVINSIAPGLVYMTVHEFNVYELSTTWQAIIFAAGFVGYWGYLDFSYLRYVRAASRLFLRVRGIPRREKRAENKINKRRKKGRI